MAAYMLRRLLWLVPTVWGAVSVIFLVLQILPGDIALAQVGGEGQAIRPEQLQALREKLGLNMPVYQQYGRWLWGIVQLDLGKSWWTGMPVASEIGIRLPYTLSLVFLALVIGALMAIPIGLLSAVKHGTWVDNGLRVFAVAGLSIPSFCLAVLVILFLLAAFRWFPPLVYAPVYQKPAIAVQQLIFPALALGYYQAAVGARMLRSSMLEVLREDYVRTARAKGLTERAVVYVHAMRNAVLPVITVFGIAAVGLFSGAVIVEQVFRIPGVGTLLTDALLRRDVPVVQGVVLVMVVFTVALNLLVDLIYAVIDPRIRYK